MIPVVGMPVLNKHDLMQRMFDSIDYGPIDRLFIIDNSGTIDKSKVRWPWHVNRIHVADPGYNTGVAAGWNMIIRANANAPYWIIVNNDLILEPGSLDKLRMDMDDHANEPHLGMIAMGNENWGNHFGAFALNDHAIDAWGWFDENLIPIYFEDTDYKRRLERLGVDKTHTTLIPSRTHHDGNQSWQSNPSLAAQNKSSWAGNVEYYDGKWHREFELGEDPKDWLQPSITRIRKQEWHIDRKDNVKDG